MIPMLPRLDVATDAKQHQLDDVFFGLRFFIGLSFAGNVGVVSGIFSPQNDRHADMSAPCPRHDTDHVGDIAPCRLAGHRVGVVSACVNCDVSAPCRRYVAQA